MPHARDACVVCVGWRAAWGCAHAHGDCACASACVCAAPRAAAAHARLHPVGGRVLARPRARVTDTLPLQRDRHAAGTLLRCHYAQRDSISAAADGTLRAQARKRGHDDEATRSTRLRARALLCSFASQQLVAHAAAAAAAAAAYCTVTVTTAAIWFWRASASASGEALPHLRAGQMLLSVHPACFEPCACVLSMRAASNTRHMSPRCSAPTPGAVFASLRRLPPSSAPA
jgi:hypothetical protein